MLTLTAIQKLNKAKAEGTDTGFAFDWDKAARLIRERTPKIAEAGLTGDFEWTGGTIYENGKPNMDPSTYLASKWCRASLFLDGEEIDCTINKSECEWVSNTVWPQSALDILEGK